MPLRNDKRPPEFYRFADHRLKAWVSSSEPGLRLAFLTVMLLAAAVLALLPPPLRALGRNYEVRQIGPHTFVYLPEDIMDQSGDPYFSRAGNVGFVITPEGVVVIDTTDNPTHAREVLYEIRQRTDIPVRLVIDLGPEGDEVLGNEIFAEQRATIVSSSDTVAEMRAYEASFATRSMEDPELPVRMRGIHFTLPEQTFKGNTAYTLGGTQIRVVALDCGSQDNGAGDAVVYLPQERVLFLGDLYVKGFVPQMNGRDVERWIGALRDVGSWNATTFVPGHGDPGTRSDLANFRGFLEWLHAGVQTGIREGKSLEQVQQQLLSSSAFNLQALDLAPRTIAEVYHQLSRTKSARTSPQGTVRAPTPQSLEAPPLAAPSFAGRGARVPR